MQFSPPNPAPHRAKPDELRIRGQYRQRARSAAVCGKAAAEQLVAGGRSNQEVAQWLSQRALSTASAVGALQAGTGKRCVIGLAGCPGGGKSTLSTDVVAAINRASDTDGLAVVLPMDGYHYWRRELDLMPDPAEARRSPRTDPQLALLHRHALEEDHGAHRRRGAPWTFDGAAFVAAVRRARDGERVSVPSFDHAAGDPVPDAIQIGDDSRIVVVEGNYLLLPEQPWAALHTGAEGGGAGGILHEAWFVDVGVDEAMGRIVKRHMQANGDSRERAEARVAVNDRLNAEQVWLTRGRAGVLVPSFPLTPS